MLLTPMRVEPGLGVENDPRGDAARKLLRATRIDECPQLINVLKGGFELRRVQIHSEALEVGNAKESASFRRTWAHGNGTVVAFGARSENRPASEVSTRFVRYPKSVALPEIR